MIKAKQNAQAAIAVKGATLAKHKETLHRASKLAIDAEAQAYAAKSGKGNATELMIAALMTNIS